MKNVFFALVFMLVGTFAFANNAEVETLVENVAIENALVIDEVSLDTEMVCGFTVNFDTNEGSGSFWMDCDDSTTMDDILNVLFELFW